MSLISKTKPRRHMMKICTLFRSYLFSVLQVHPISQVGFLRLDSTESDLGSTWGQVIEDACNGEWVELTSHPFE